MRDPFDARSQLSTVSGDVSIFRLAAIEEAGLTQISRLPFSIRVLLESALRNLDGFAVTEEHVQSLSRWTPEVEETEIAFVPARVVLQDFTGVPAIVDLAAMRSAMHRLGGDPGLINPRVPSDLVIDHSVQVDAYGSRLALEANSRREFERNAERYAFLRWGQGALKSFRVIPPAGGIVHQVNLEHLATVVARREHDGAISAFPDSLVGTDSHTTMINGLGVLGWGVGGIEAEAVMLGQPVYMLMPRVVGFRLIGALPEGATATDLVLTATEILRQHGVVGKFVEYYGDGLDQLSLPDRATLANMAPEYGATVGFFPVDGETVRYLERTGRGGDTADLVDRYCREQGLFRTDETTVPEFSEHLELDLGTVVPSMAGPKRPQDRFALEAAAESFRTALTDGLGGGSTDSARGEGTRTVRVQIGDGQFEISDGAVVLAAITSCTNTSNPSVMLSAGLLAKRAVELGLHSAPWVKTSLAPGSRVVTRYLDDAGLLPYLEALGFHVVGYGCTTCIGNSGPLPDPVADAIRDNDLVSCAVLSGNRNFEGRVNPLVKANYLASPPLVVAYAIAGSMDVDISADPIGTDPNGRPVYLSDVWPDRSAVQAALAQAMQPEHYEEEYASVFEGGEQWRSIPASTGLLYEWDDESTYIREPPFFKDLTAVIPPLEPIKGARVLAMLGDSVTTDHISPAGPFAPESPAGQYLIGREVTRPDFNSYGSRRGNHEVMMRGTLANIRLRNELAPGTEGGFTTYLPDGTETTIFEASEAYRARGTDLIIVAGSEYGTGSSRDWAAKGVMLLGVRAVIAESFERIHRSNLVGMGVLPLQFATGDDRNSLGLTGREAYDIQLPSDIEPGQRIEVTAVADDGSETRFVTLSRIDSPVEVRYFLNGGILHTVLRDLLAASVG